MNKKQHFYSVNA